MTLEDALADVSCQMEERGTQAVLNRYGVTLQDIEELSYMASDDLVKQAVLLHGLLLGLSLAELRQRESV